MMKSKFWSPVIFNSSWHMAALFCALVTLHCEGADPLSRPTAAVPDQLSLSPSNPQIAQGTGLQFNVRVLYPDGRRRDLTQSVKWTLLAQGKRLLTMPADGLLSAPEPGRYQVRAEYQGRTLTTALTVTDATVKSVSLSPLSPQVAKGLTQPFTAIASLSDGTTQDVTKLASWSVKDLVGTGVALLSSTGVATAKKVGQAKILVSYKSRSASTTLTVTAATLTALSLSPTSPSIAKGTSQAFSARGTFSDGTIQDVTAAADWSVMDVVGSGVAAIDGTGLAVGQGVGQAAVSAAYLGRAAQTTLSVTPAVPVSLALSPSAAAIAKGTTQPFTATATLTDGTTQDISALVTWTTTDVTGTGVASINSAGVCRGNAVGQATINGVYRGLSSSARVTVTPAVLTAIAVTPAGAHIVKGTYQGFSAIGTYSDGTLQDLTQLAVWSVSDLVGSDVAAAFDLGFQEGVYGKNLGQATLSATYMGLTGTTTLTVDPVTLAALAVSPVSETVLKGETKQFTATGWYTDGTTQDLTSVAKWTAVDVAPAAGVVKLSTSGLATGAKLGQATITASYLGFSDSTTLTVIALSSLAISPLNTSINQLATEQYTATGTFSDGTTQDLTTLVSWKATDIAPAVGVATIDATGLATGSQVGQATVLVTYLGLSASTTLTVACVGESNHDFCAGKGVTAGGASGLDRCGQYRAVYCGCYDASHCDASISYYCKGGNVFPPGTTAYWTCSCSGPNSIRIAFPWGDVLTGPCGGACISSPFPICLK